MSKSRIGEKFDCTVTCVDGLIRSDFDWLDGIAARWFTEDGDEMRWVGEIMTEDGFLLTDVTYLKRAPANEMHDRRFASR